MTLKAERIVFTLILLPLLTGGFIPAAFTGSSREEESTPQAVQLLWMNHTVGGVRKALLTREGEYVTAGGKGFVARLEAHTGRRIWIIERPFQVDSMDESDDGSIILAGLEQARLWAIKGDGSIIWENSTEGPVLALDLTPRGDKAVLGTFFGTLYFAYPMDRRVEAAYRREGMAVIEAALSGDGSTAAVGYSDDVLEGYRWGIPEPIWHITITGHPNVLAYSPRGDRLILGTSIGALYVLDPYTGETLSTFKADNAISCIAFLDDYSKMAVGSNDGCVYIIDLEDGSSSCMYRIEGAVKSIAYIRNGSILCVGGADRRFRALNMDTGNELGSIKAGYWVTSISSSEYGLIVFGAGNSLYMVRIAVGEGEEEHPSPMDHSGSPRGILIYGVIMVLLILAAATYLFMKRRRGRGGRSEP